MMQDIGYYGKRRSRFSRDAKAAEAERENLRRATACGPKQIYRQRRREGRARSAVHDAGKMRDTLAPPFEIVLISNLPPS